MTGLKLFQDDHFYNSIILSTVYLPFFSIKVSERCCDAIYFIDAAAFVPKHKPGVVILSGLPPHRTTGHPHRGMSVSVRLHGALTRVGRIRWMGWAPHRPRARRCVGA